jgi:hypothetical protein
MFPQAAKALREAGLEGSGFGVHEEMTASVRPSFLNPEPRTLNPFILNPEL